MWNVTWDEAARIGYISRYTVEGKQHFLYLETPFVIFASCLGERIRCEHVLTEPLSYDDVEFNTRMMTDFPDVILVEEPFFVDDELRKIATRWVEWANHADPSEYDPFIVKGGDACE